ncbi:hypothetical protein FB451DRAFT_1168402 [Mycena latifolia]|nr:hypothetical protein FB451DRAFT_1168402 [Mycena latifolia]
MDEPANPSGIQELLEQCIEFLRDSPSDLKTCALVSRSWTSAAQGHILRQFSIRVSFSQCMWERNEKILHRSPHLIRLIRRLHLEAHKLSSFGTFSAIFAFPFTRLHDVCIPTRVGITQTVSLSIQALFGRCTLSSKPIMRPTPHIHSTHITPQSLRIRAVDYVANWAAEDLRPLDLSHLKVLPVPRGHGESFRSKKFAAARRTIEVLNIIPEVLILKQATSDEIINLSDFLKLVSLATDWQPALENLSTIAAPNRIQKLAIYVRSRALERECCLPQMNTSPGWPPGIWITTKRGSTIHVALEFGLGIRTYCPTGDGTYTRLLKFLASPMQHERREFGLPILCSVFAKFP